MERLLISLSGRKTVKRPGASAVAKAKKVLRKARSADAAEEKQSLQEKVAAARARVKEVESKIKDLDSKYAVDSAKRKKVISKLQLDLKEKMEKEESADARYRARQAKLQADLKAANLRLNNLK